MTQNANSTGTAKISTFVTAATYITLILALIAIGVGIAAFYENPNNAEITIWLLVIGFIALAMSGYYMFQSRKHVASLKLETPQIQTAIDCKACNAVQTRPFKRGDYVYKEMEQCPKCNSMGMIVAIYREVKEKEKPVNV
jgi:hypothetical protein